MSLSHSPSIVRNGLVLYLDPANSRSYPGTGTTWTDLSGNGNNATLTNSPTYSTSNNGIFTFNGSTQYATVTNTNGFGNAGLSPNQTMSIWYNQNDNNSFDFLCGFRNDSNYDFFLLIIDTGSGNTLEARIRTSNVGIDTNVSYLDSYNNTWKNITLSVNGSSIKTYIDGSLLNSTNSLTGNYGATSTNFSIGAHPVDQAWKANGSIGTVLFYNRQLSDAEVRQNFNATKGRYGL